MGGELRPGLADVLTLQGQIARAIPSGIKMDLQPQEKARLGTVRQVNPEAEIAYLNNVLYHVFAKMFCSLN